MSWKLIAISWYADNSIVSKGKLCIFEAPSIIFKPLFFISDRLSTFDFLAFKLKCKWRESLHPINYKMIWYDSTVTWLIQLNIIYLLPINTVQQFIDKLVDFYLDIKLKFWEFRFFIIWYL